MNEAVYIIGINGKPEMPCFRRGRIRHLLKDHKAKKVKNSILPTFQLLYEQGDVYTQDVHLGLDEGANHIGVSATSHQKEILSLELEIRSNDVKKRKDDQRMNRRDRRSRKTRYRKPRFNNRGNSKKKDRLSPTAKHREDTHVNIVKYVHSILPVTHQTFEEARFDTQMIENPSISGTEYQQGKMNEHENFKEFVRYRDNYTCAICHTKGKGDVHHIIPVSKGGTDRADNGVFLCKKCHEDLHKGKVKLPENLNLAAKNLQKLKDAAAMNTMSKRLIGRMRKEFPNVKTYRTFGSITKANRQKFNINKTHADDARVISGYPEATPLGYTYCLTQLRRHYRQMHEHQPRIRKAHDGKPGMSRAKRRKLGYVRRECREIKSVFGFTKRSIVLYERKKWMITGLRQTGFFSLVNIKDNKERINSIKYTKLKLIKPQYKSIVIDHIRRI